MLCKGLPQKGFLATTSDCGIGSNEISLGVSNPALRHIVAYSAKV